MGRDAPQAMARREGGPIAILPKVAHRPRLRPRSNLLPLEENNDPYVMVAQDNQF